MVALLGEQSLKTLSSQFITHGHGSSWSGTVYIHRCAVLPRQPAVSGTGSPRKRLTRAGTRVRPHSPEDLGARPPHWLVVSTVDFRKVPDIFWAHSFSFQPASVKIYMQTAVKIGFSAEKWMTGSTYTRKAESLQNKGTYR